MPYDSSVGTPASDCTADIGGTCTASAGVHQFWSSKYSSNVYELFPGCCTAVGETCYGALASGNCRATANPGEEDRNDPYGCAPAERTEEGAVWVLRLNADATVKASQQIKNGGGGLSAHLAPHAFFGSAVASLGDINGDGV